VTDIVEFIRARLDEDERVALAANGPHWRPGDGNVSEGGLYALDGDGSDEGRGWSIAWFQLGETNPGRQLPAFSSWKRRAHENGVHAARHDPARVLREVEATRAVLAEYEHALERRAEHPDDVASAGALLTMVRVMKLLALPYAEHPDYRKEWRP